MKRVTEKTDFYLSKYELEGSFDDVVASIRAVEKQALDAYHEMCYDHLNPEFYFDWEPAEDGGDVLTLYVKRDELHHEALVRIMEEQARQADFEKYEQELYLRLHEKYGKVLREQ